MPTKSYRESKWLDILGRLDVQRLGAGRYRIVGDLRASRAWLKVCMSDMCLDVGGFLHVLGFAQLGIACLLAEEGRPVQLRAAGGVCVDA